MGLERYSPEDAKDEADLIARKVKSGEAQDYSGAETLVEKEKNKERLQQAIENAKNGVTASLIRSLDLSTEEGIKKLRQVVTDQRILDSNGVPFLPFNLKMDETMEYHLRGLLEIRDGIDKAYVGEKMSKEEMRTWSVESSIMNWGHGLVKIGRDILPFMDVNWDVSYPSLSHLTERIEKQEYVSNDSKLLMALAVIADTTGEAFNTGLPGFVIQFSYGEVKGGLLSEEEFQQRLESFHIPEALHIGKQVLQTIERLFMKYLSNIVQDVHYIAPENQQVVPEELMKDVEFIKEMSHRRFRHNLLNQKDLINWIEKYAERTDPKGMEIREAVKKETDYFIERLQEFQHILDEYDRKMSYATPKISEA